jgi:squalene-hopene/tetraprenyl-beta-curcumene cyclase
MRAGWDPRLAAKYLDARQQEWFAWPPAKATGGTCLSCHTGATYLLARPALRRMLGESGPTSSEIELRAGLRARAGLRDGKEIKRAFAAEPMASQALGVEAVFAALFLNSPGPAGATDATLDADARRAFDRLWSLQLRQGPARGAWAWFNLDLDPYEMPPSQFYGATVAALAAGNAPAAYLKQPEVQERIAELNAYFARERESQPLHNRLMLLWASTKLSAAMPPASRRATIAEIWRKQAADGGWTTESLGPWKEHPRAPLSKGSNSYATGLVAAVLEKVDADSADPRLARALAWLESRQDPQTGAWEAGSMNKQYEPGSMQAQFMRDAATAYAAMALSERAEHIAK